MKLLSRIILFILIPVILLPVALVHYDKRLLCLYMLIVMALFWILDILPYGVTSFIPIIFAPMMEIEMSITISRYYASDGLFLCLGRLILACAYQRHQIHRRFGLFLLTKFGAHPRMIMLSCMIPSFVLTMVISNTATAPIMLEFVIEVLEQLKFVYIGMEMNDETPRTSAFYGTIEREPIVPHSLLKSSLRSMSYTMNDEYPSMTNAIERNKNIHERALMVSINEVPTPRSENFEKMSLALSLSTAYAATCGGLATLVAGGPNIILYTLMLDHDENSLLNYGTFTAACMPVAIVTTLLTWLWIGIVNIGPKEFFSTRKMTKKEIQFQERMQEEKDKLGKISFAELSCIGFTVIAMILWISRSNGKFRYGWGRLFVNNTHQTNGEIKEFVTDATPIILVLLFVFIWPSRWDFWRTDDDETPGDERLLTWDAVHKIMPWGVIFLLGAGLAIGEICRASGLSDYISCHLEKGLSKTSDPVIIIIASILGCMTTEVLSATTITPVYIMIFKSLADRKCKNMFIYLMPLTMSASLAFCLSAATTPNIAIFNRGLATTPQMIKNGLLMDIVFIFVVLGFTYMISVPMFNGLHNPNCTRVNLTILC